MATGVPYLVAVAVIADHFASRLPVLETLAEHHLSSNFKMSPAREFNYFIRPFNLNVLLYSFLCFCLVFLT